MGHMLILIKNVEIKEAPAGFELFTYRHTANALAHCTTLLGNTCDLHG